MALSSPAGAQNSPSVVQAGGGPGSGHAGYATAVDAFGNRYVTGAFSGTATFGSRPDCTVSTVAVATNGAFNTDLFVVKYDGLGVCEWAEQSNVQAGKVLTNGDRLVDASNPNPGTVYPAFVRGLSIAVDSNNDVYVTGSFFGRNAFGTLSTTWLDTNLFIVSYTSGGQPRTGAIKAYSAIHPNVGFPNVSPGPPTCDDNANVLRLHTPFVPPDGIEGLGIAVDPNNQVYVTGNFYGDVCFGTATSTPRTAAGRTDVFVVQYNGLGSNVPVWLNTGGSAGLSATGRGIAVDGQESYVVGDFGGTMAFKGTNGLPNGPAASPIGGMDVFVARFDSSGTAVTGWPKAYGHAFGDDTGAGIAIDDSSDPGDRSIFVTGQFGSGAFPQTGFLPAVLAKLDGSGNPLWARAGGRGSSVVAGQGNAYVTGLLLPFATRPTVALTLSDVTGYSITATAASRTALWPGFSLDDVGKQIRHSGKGIAQIVGVEFPPNSFTSLTAKVNILKEFASLTVADNEWEIAPFVSFAAPTDPPFPPVGLFATGNGGMFVGKYAADGQMLWLGQGETKPATAPPASRVLGLGVATDGNSALVTGSFQGQATFAFRYSAGLPIPDPGVTKTSGVDGDIFLATFESPTPPPGGPTLTITVDGTGLGVVQSDDGFIVCPSDCQEPYTTVQTVGLTVIEALGSTFAGWSGPDAAECASGTVTVDMDKSCTATFNRILHTLTVVKSGGGSGTVTEDSGEINCGPTCATDSGQFGETDVVALKQTPEPGSVFGAWGGDCNPQGAVTISADRTCTASFLRISSIGGLASLPASSVAGDLVILTATVNGAAPFGGSVTFTIDGVPQSPTSTDSTTGTATLPFRFISAATHVVTAQYSGDQNNTGSAPSVPLQIVVGPGQVSGTAVRGILAGLYSPTSPPITQDISAGAYAVDSTVGPPQLFDARLGSSFVQGLLPVAGPHAKAYSSAYLSPDPTVPTRSAGRAISYVTYVNDSAQSIEAPAQAVLDGFFTGTTPSHVSVAVYVFDKDAFLNRIAGSGMTLAQFLVGTDTLGDYAAGTQAALSLTAPRSGPTRPALFDPSILKALPAFASQPSSSGSSVNSTLNPTFTVNPGESVVILFDLTVYSESGSSANFSATLKPGPNFLKDPSGNPLPLTAVGLWSPEPPATANLTLTPAATTNALTTPVTVTATATTASGAPVANTLVVLDIVSGPNANAVGPALTDANGQVALTYSGGSATGTDQIQAHIGTLQSNLATVTWTAGPLDRITISPSSATIAAGGSQAFTTQAFDQFGNSRGDVTAGTTFTIAPSGSCTGATCTASTAGPHVVTATSDGKTATASLEVTVTSSGYAFQGFYSPIDMSTPSLMVWNTVKAGQAVPVKWRLLQDGVPVGSPASFLGLSAYPIACSSGAGSIDDAIEQGASGSSGLQYNGDGNWQFNWRTPSADKGMCRAVVVRLADGSISPPAYFKLK